jgi:hypothetical protein
MFDMDFPKGAACGGFELPLLRNAQKRTQKNGGGDKGRRTKKKKATYLPTFFEIF